MANKDDEPDIERYADRDKSRSEFDSGPTEEQIQRAEKMLGGLDLATFVEKRNLSEDYRAASLQPADGSAEPVEVLISAHPVPGDERHVVLSRNELPAMRAAEITIRRLGQHHTMTGSLQPSHKGQRAEDKQNGTLMVSFFYPAE